MADPREEVERALAQAVEIAGPSLLQEPQRLKAILADLVGRPDSDHRDEIGAITAVTDIMANSGLSDEERIVAELTRQQTSVDARWATSTLARHGAQIQSRGTGVEATPMWRRPWALASMIVALVAGLMIFLLLPSPGPSPADDDETTTDSVPVRDDTSDTSDTSETVPPEIVGYQVDFDRATEGLLDAERTWVIQEGQVTGTIVLIPSSDSGIAQHRELVPAIAFTDPVFTPEPTTEQTQVNGDIVASFSIDQSGGPFTITFEASLTTAEPDQATVDSWRDNWRERVPSMRPVDDEEPANATVTPLT